MMSVVAYKAANVGAYVVNIFLNFRYGKNIRRLSETYDHIATPKGQAFGIWALIYTWELVWVLAQAGTEMYDDILPSLTPWFCAGTLMQGVWVYFFTLSNPKTPGDFWIFFSSVLLIVIPVPFLGACGSLASVQDGKGPAYWLSYGITVNAAWVLLAAGLSVNLMAVAAGLRGMALSAVALLVLAVTVVLLLFITGLVGSNPFNSPTAFFTVGIWALYWVYQALKEIPNLDGAEELLQEVPENGEDKPKTREQKDRDHFKRILPMYGSRFVTLYKWTAVALLAVFACLEVVVCLHKPVFHATSA